MKLKTKRPPKLKPIGVGDTINIGQEVLALHDLNRDPVPGVIEKIEAPFTDNFGRIWQCVWVKFPIGGKDFHLCNTNDAGLYWKPIERK